MTPQPTAGADGIDHGQGSGQGTADVGPTDPPEHYAVDIPLPPQLLFRIGARVARAGVDAGGVYDDKIVAVAVYDRPWPSPIGPGQARLLGTIYVSTRTDRVYRIEVSPDGGATFDDLLTHLERLIGLPTDEPDSGGGR